MLYTEILNHMEPDELRNYVCHLQEVDDATCSLIHAQQECIDWFQRLVSAMNYKFDSRVKLNDKLAQIHAVEQELEKKYDEFIPRPVCCMEAKDE